MTHLECSLTGERYDAGRLHNLSRRRAGRCWRATIVEQASASLLTREVLGGASPRACGSGASCCRCRRTPSRSRSVRGCRRSGPPRGRARRPRTGKAVGQDESELPTGSFTAPGMPAAVSLAEGTLGDPPGWPCRRPGTPAGQRAAYAPRGLGRSAHGFSMPALTPRPSTPDGGRHLFGAKAFRRQRPDHRLRQDSSAAARRPETCWVDLVFIFKEPYRLEGKKTRWAWSWRSSSAGGCRT